jgi:hypothetical protein
LYQEAALVVMVQALRLEAEAAAAVIDSIHPTHLV